MGSTKPFTISEVAEILEVSDKTVHRLTRESKLRLLPGGGQLYDAEEVWALREARNRAQTLPAIAEIAHQAWAAGRTAQDRIKALESLLGVYDVPIADLDKDSILGLHESAKQALQEDVTVELVEYWAKKLVTVCEQYMHRVHEVTGIPDPWSAYLTLSSYLVQSRNYMEAEVNPAERLAYRRLNVARERLRRATFTYVLQTQGVHAAKKLYPREFEGEHHEVLINALYG